MNKIQLDLPVLLPEIDAHDDCVQLLSQWLEPIKGIEQAHLVKNNGDSKLCLHYDPNLVSLERVKRLAEETGLNITNRFRHEQIPISSLNSADAADVIARLHHQDLSRAESKVLSAQQVKDRVAAWRRAAPPKFSSMYCVKAAMKSWAFTRPLLTSSRL